MTNKIILLHGLFIKRYKAIYMPFFSKEGKEKGLFISVLQKRETIIDISKWYLIPTYSLKDFLKTIVV